MKMAELAQEYRKSAMQLKDRIRQLQREQKQTKDPEQIGRLEGRIELLKSMYRDTRLTAALCEHYYERGYHSNKKYKI